MRRLTLWAARAVVKVADRLLRAPLAGDATVEADEEEEDLGMPTGHPVVVRSAKAEAMIQEGAAYSYQRPSAKPVFEPPLRGSLQDRMKRNDL